LKATDRQQLAQWTWPHKPLQARADLYLELWGRLKFLPYEQIRQVIKQLKDWAGPGDTNSLNGCPMNEEELRVLCAHPLFSLGLHTLTHPTLSKHSREVQYKELGDNKTYLESFTGQSVNTLAYPYGDFNKETLTVAQELQITGAFTTVEKSINCESSLHQLGRCQVRNWDKFNFTMKISEWFSKA